MSGIIGLLTGAFGGSVIGAIGGTAQKYLEGKNELKKLKLTQEHESAMSQLELQQMQMQLDNTKAIAEVDATVQVAKADSNALIASLENDTASYSTVDVSKSNKWLIAVDVIRGLMRPIITGGLATYCVLVTGYNMIEYGAEMPTDQIAATTFALIDSMATYTGLAISWWFGSRGHKAGGK